MRQIFHLTVICFFALASSDCRKKIAKYPFEMEGIWRMCTPSCCFIFVIDKNGVGETYDAYSESCKEFSPDLDKGTVRYKTNKLYIGEQKYYFRNRPTSLVETDSLTFPSDSLYMAGNHTFDYNRAKKYKVLAEMTLSNAPNGMQGTIFTFYKYVDF